MNTGETAILVVVEFGVELFRRVMAAGGVAGWNACVRDLAARGLVPVCWTGGEQPPALGVMFDLAGLRARATRLDGIDLGPCWLAEADFTGSSLKGARIGCCPGASFRNAQLGGIDFGWVDVSGCNFSGARLDGVVMDRAVYDPTNPPVGLPREAMAVCRPETEPPPGDRSRPANPMEPTGFQETPLRCRATFHLIPMEE